MKISNKKRIKQSVKAAMKCVNDTLGVRLLYFNKGEWLDSHRWYCKNITRSFSIEITSRCKVPFDDTTVSLIEHTDKLPLTPRVFIVSDSSGNHLRNRFIHNGMLFERFRSEVVREATLDKDSLEFTYI